MRRDELAAAAGVSAEYIKRLEQGHGRPSAAVLRALARALRLSGQKYEHCDILTIHEGDLRAVVYTAEFRLRRRRPPRPHSEMKDLHQP